MVVVDALNFLNRFVPIDEPAFEHALPPALFDECNRRVWQMMSAAIKNRVHLTFVFDKGQHTDESIFKWRQRRCEEVVNANKRMPTNADVYFVAILERHGAVCLRPPNIDGDDAVALLAVKMGADVLSRDRDFLRYTELPATRVFRDFGIDSVGKLRLERQMAPLPKHVSMRTLADIDLEASTVDRRGVGTEAALQDLQNEWRHTTPFMCEGGRNGEAQRGNADENTALLGNLNLTALGLAASVYHALGVPPTKAVGVSMPEAIASDSGKLDATIAPNWVRPNPCIARAIVAKDPFLAKRWLEQSSPWFDLPDAHCENSPIENVKLLKRMCGRSHAICALASEISDAYRYAINDTETPYSSAQRQYSVYRMLLKGDAVLDPGGQPWYAALSDASRQEHDKRLLPLGVGTQWAAVQRCKGLFGGKHCCKALTESDGYCFSTAIAYASTLKKKPLCNACISSLATNGNTANGKAKSNTNSHHGVKTRQQVQTFQPIRPIQWLVSE